MNSAEVSLSCRKESFLEGRGLKQKACSDSDSHSPAAMFAPPCPQRTGHGGALAVCRRLRANQRRVCSPTANQRRVSSPTANQRLAWTVPSGCTESSRSGWSRLFRPISAGSCACCLGDGRRRCPRLWLFISKM